MSIIEFKVKKSREGHVTYSNRIVLRYRMARGLHKNISQPPLLMYNALEVAFIVREWGLRLLAEALNPAPCRVLDDNVVRKMGYYGVIISVIDDNRDGSSSGVSHDLVEKLGRWGTRVTKDASVSG